MTIPVKGVPVKVGAGGGAQSQTSGGVSTTITETEEDIKQSTVKSANALKKSVSSTVETAEETGLETTVTDTIVNPNKCHSLTYHFFEIQETFAVKTALEKIEPYLLIPLEPVEPTKAWLLCHECILKKHIPCESYYQGFEAAKKLLVNENLGLFMGTLQDEQIDQMVETILEAVRQVLRAYLSLANATLLPVGGTDESGNILEDIWNAIEDGGNALAEEWNRFTEDPVGYVEDKGEDLVDVLEEGASNLAETLESGFSSAVDTAGGVLGGLFGQAQTALPSHVSGQARSVAPGGIGSYIYWEVLKITAPEIEAALSGLNSAVAQIESMPAGPARTQALFSALQAFFSTIGDVNEAFAKVDTGLFYLMAGTTLAGVAGAGLLATLAGAAMLITGGGAAVAAIAAGAAFLGIAATEALVGLGGAILAYLGDEAGVTDLAPDDQGLQSAIQGLYGLFQQMGQAVSLPAPPQDGSPEAVAAYERALAEMKSERQESAQASVEYERLACHIREHRAFYLEVVARSLSEADIRRRLSEEFNIPPHVVEAKFSGFIGNRAALRVRDLEWLKLSGYDFQKTLEDLKKKNLFERKPEKLDITMPTLGVVVEPALGQCQACDDFIVQHRKMDLKAKEEELAQAHQETLRLKKRIDKGLLGDPTPFEGANNLSVEVEKPSED